MTRETNTTSRMVGVLGGMGPAATADFYAKLIAATPASRDQDHLRVVIWADPTAPDRTRALASRGESPLPWLRRGVQQLVQSGAEILVVPCNTVHAYMPDAVADTDIQFISIIDVAADQAQQASSTGKVGLLATEALIDAGLYQEALSERGLEAVVPTPQIQARLMQVIYQVKAGDTGRVVRDVTASILDALARQGVTSVIAACTEISVLVSRLTTSIPVIDPSHALALRAVSAAVERPALVSPERS
ncbi:aspartate/glutamate racemase family protein [Microbacterium sp. MPKO10]|uniref:aspartate/glutamate racemase family protein n=1 Tax=Microbacterium sp. MPKO10 TaxID=2989818 RepID=UPI002235AB69|nr:amino acid racemase [Microbacterium sp. MPKO10]MCW4458032.1 amino acid racemase [Microbacterium sp. MPKO10]